jgi:hypothetical protein
MGAQVAPADQQNLRQTMVVGGGSGPLNVTALKAAAGQTNVYQFTKDFQIVFGQGASHGTESGAYCGIGTDDAALARIFHNDGNRNVV